MRLRPDDVTDGGDAPGFGVNPQPADWSSMGQRLLPQNVVLAIFE